MTIRNGGGSGVAGDEEDEANVCLDITKVESCDPMRSASYQATKAERLFVISLVGLSSWPDPRLTTSAALWMLLSASFAKASPFDNYGGLG